MIRNIQQATAEGLLEAIVVTGINAYGTPRERYRLSFDPLTNDMKVMVDLNEGKTHLEALDSGLAMGVQSACDTLRRKNLRPEFTFMWSAEARGNPARLADAQKRLGFTDAPPLQPVVSDAPPTPTWMPPAPTPTWMPTPATRAPAVYTMPPGYVFKPVITITPAKDKGVHFTMETLRRS